MEQESINFTFSSPEKLAEQERAEFEAFLWGNLEEITESPVSAEGESAQGIVETAQHPSRVPIKTLNEELPLLLQAKEAQREFLAGLGGVLPQVFSFLAACGPACVAHGHGLVSALSTSGAGVSGGIGIPGLHHDHDHSHGEHEHHRNFDSPTSSNQPVKWPVPSKSPRVTHSSVELLWLPAIWSFGKTVPLNELWAPQGRRTAVNDLCSSFLGADEKFAA